MKIEGNDYSLDTNVTIHTPDVEVEYDVNFNGWLVKINGSIITLPNGVTAVFKDVSQATDYLIAKNLIITKAYEEFRKRVTKSLKPEKKKEQKDGNASARVGKHPASRG